MTNKKALTNSANTLLCFLTSNSKPIATTLNLTPKFMTLVDTHKFIKSFTLAKTNEEKAEAIINVVTEAKTSGEKKLEETFSYIRENFATKTDLKDLELRLTNNFKDSISNLTMRFFFAIGGLAVFLTGLIIGVLPLILSH